MPSNLVENTNVYATHSINNESNNTPRRLVNRIGNTNVFELNGKHIGKCSALN